MTRDRIASRVYRLRRIEMTNGCRAGKCESCELRILGGECMHRIDFSHAGNVSCFSCQATPTADVVIEA
ncbi:2Fe-2S iron-sulfur cluster-binding protein [Mesorhizobium sp. WSM4962]|uniref:2Fe-2S iron-sulfur cluster-binding protein n=1 Tax=Mesorhizobium sp. WSM4962 TaxID=3038548 RepID=UPI003FA583BF